MQRQHIMVTGREASCACDCKGDPWDEDDCCGEPGWSIRIVTMHCEDIPAMYPHGSWRGGRVMTSAACPRHIIEWANQIVEQWPPDRPTLPERPLRSDSSSAYGNSAQPW